MDTLDFTSRSVPSRHLPVGDYDMDTEEFVEDKRSFDDFQAPAGTRIPETVGREIQMDFTDQGDAGDRVGTAPIDGPEDAVGGFSKSFQQIKSKKPKMSSLTSTKQPRQQMQVQTTPTTQTTFLLTNSKMKELRLLQMQLLQPT